MTLSVDADVCIGSGNCEYLSPALFAIQDDGSLAVLQRDVPAELVDVAEQAVRECPARALSLSRGTLAP